MIDGWYTMGPSGRRLLQQTRRSWRSSLDAELLHLASITYVGKHHDATVQIADRSLTVVGQMADIAPRWVRRGPPQLDAGELWMPNEDGW